jgi:hypothetical protein
LAGHYSWSPLFFWRKQKELQLAWYSMRVFFSAIAFIVIMLLNFVARAVLASAVPLTQLTLFSAL